MVETPRPTAVKPNVVAEKMIESPRQVIQRIPSSPLHFSEIPHGNWCAMYARLAAEHLFGLRYVRGDAWKIAELNRTVWKSSRDGDQGFRSHLRPGQVLGIFNPVSKYNKEGIPYTHVALYVGTKNGAHYIMHRVGSKDILETLESFYNNRRGWVIREVIEPKEGS
ncbi:MAG: hypothetical protein U1C71_02880 [archaeon]|nr:hypothetical protein [archaeon]